MASEVKVDEWGLRALAVRAKNHPARELRNLHEACDPYTIISLLDRIDALEEGLRAIVARWDTPLWKDVEPTAAVINRARALLSEREG